MTSGTWLRFPGFPPIQGVGPVITEVTHERGDSMDLNEIMQMDHVIQVHADGSVTDAPADVYGPEVSVETDAEGSYTWTRDDHGKLTWNIHVDGPGWTLLNGYAADDGSEILPNAQYIGGDLAAAIRATPGYYVATVVSDGTDEPGGWCVAFKEAQA